MVNELIDYIEVYHAEKADGMWQQKLTIHYNCIGPIELPEVAALPPPEVTFNTRKGVFVSYPGSKSTQTEKVSQ